MASKKKATKNNPKKAARPAALSSTSRHAAVASKVAAARKAPRAAGAKSAKPAVAPAKPPAPDTKAAKPKALVKAAPPSVKVAPSAKAAAPNAKAAAPNAKAAAPNGRAEPAAAAKAAPARAPGPPAGKAGKASKPSAAARHENGAPIEVSRGEAPRSAPPQKGARAAARPSQAAAPAPRREPPRAPPRTPPQIVTLPIPALAAPKRPSIEERSASIDARLNAQSEDFRRRYIESFDMSWIYHDSALEGVVYTSEELRAALQAPPGMVPQPVADSTIQPTCDDIRRHKEAIDFVRDFATKKRLPVTLDVVKKIYLILRPEEGDVKTVKYRKDVPQHRLYFHEYAPPDKIAYKVRQIVDWLNDPETRKTRNGIRIAARAHYDLLRVFPFPTESGKVARLFMNLLLLRSGLPPSIIHSTERQRYYEALKGSATTVLQMVQESVENALSSVEKLLDEHETRTRAFVS